MLLSVSKLSSCGDWQGRPQYSTKLFVTKIEIPVKLHLGIAKYFFKGRSEVHTLWTYISGRLTMDTEPIINASQSDHFRPVNKPAEKSCFYVVNVSVLALHIWCTVTNICCVVLCWCPVERTVIGTLQKNYVYTGSRIILNWFCFLIKIIEDMSSTIVSRDSKRLNQSVSKHYVSLA